MHRSASAAISAGSFGVFGFRFLVVAPLIAASMITGSAIGVPHFPAELELVAVCASPTVASRFLHIDLTGEQRALQRELRDYFARLMTRSAAPRSRVARPAARRTATSSARWARRLARVGWPKEYGGQGRTPAEQFIFYDEANRAGVPMPLVTLNTVGPTLMRFGSDEQKA